MIDKLKTELENLIKYSNNAISISTTSKEAIPFRVLPRRIVNNCAVSSFMINNEDVLKQVLLFFDGKVNIIFIDIEQKQEINLYTIAREIIKESKLITFKPNDNTLESCDILIRNNFNDDLVNRNIVIIGTGNLASKLALRLAERQAKVYLKGRNRAKELTIIEGINCILPKFSAKVSSFHELPNGTKVDLIVSFVSGTIMETDDLIPLVDKNTFIIDGGINNFNKSFVEYMIKSGINITRLDTRIALPYQFLYNLDYIHDFFNNIYGKAKINNIPVVSGGYIGSDGMVIVDNINYPQQIIGIADGNGGVKSNEQLSNEDKKSIQKISEAISSNN